MVQIEKGIPMPVLLRNGGAAKYPWRQMEIGDSFFVCGLKAAQLSGTAHNAAKITGFKFAARSEPGGVRVWRVA